MFIYNSNLVCDERFMYTLLANMFADPFYNFLKEFQQFLETHAGGVLSSYVTDRNSKKVEIKNATFLPHMVTHFNNNNSNHLIL